jgi:hypothetical protein
MIHSNFFIYGYTGNVGKTYAQDSTETQTHIKEIPKSGDPVNPVRTMPALIFIMICVLTVTGCISQPGTGNRTDNISVNVTTFTPFITPVQIQCLPQKNTTPWIIINPVSDHYVGDLFEINGTTNLGVNNAIKIEIYQSHFYTEAKYLPHIYTNLWENVTVHGGYCGTNKWLFSTNTSSLLPDEYFVDVTSVNLLVKNRSVFTLYPAIQREQHIAQTKV